MTGQKMNRQPLYAFDIETTGLDWRKNRITTFAIYGEGVAIVEEDEELALLDKMHDAFAALPCGIVVTWNGAVFDGPFVYSRVREWTPDADWPLLMEDSSIKPKYEPQPGFRQIGYHPFFPAADGLLHRHSDIAYGYWRSWADARGCRHSLKPVAKANGIDVIEVDREHMESLSTEERKAYCLSDVRATYELAMLARARREASR